MSPLSTRLSVTPAKAGVQGHSRGALLPLDSGLRRNDESGSLSPPNPRPSRLH